MMHTKDQNEECVERHHPEYMLLQAKKQRQYSYYTSCFWQILHNLQAYKTCQISFTHQKNQRTIKSKHL